MRRLVFSSFLLVLLPLLSKGLLLRQPLYATNSTLDIEKAIDEIYAAADDTVKQRLAQLDHSIVEHRHDPAVRRLIGMYVERYRYGSERLLARSTAYFPYFSQQLANRQMPDALKYLTIQESALRPYALSHVGASGFWQLMPGTAREQGLIVNDTLDERLDLVRGTEAGLNYLHTQYERYEDWALAMAAYNSGPGRVNRAKRRSGSDDYWKLRKYLPRETRNYVPSYIAAAYLFTYFSAYDLVPKPMDLDLQITSTIKVYDFLSLHRVAQVTGLNPAKVIELNPAYLRGYIPASDKGRSLRLPSRTIDAMRAYLNEQHTPSTENVLPWLSPRLHQGVVEGNAFYQQYTTYPTALDTSAQQMAEWLGMPPHQLMIWSRIGPLDSLDQNQAWIYWQAVENMTFGELTRPKPTMTTAIPKATFPLSDVKVFPSRRAEEATPLLHQEKTEVSSPKRALRNIWSWIKG